MLTLDSNAQAAVDAAVRGVAWLVFLDVAGSPLRFTTWPGNIDSGGNTYLGFGPLVEVGAVSDTLDVDATQLVLRLTLVDTSILSLLLGSVENYRGRAVTLALQLVNESGGAVGAAVPRWAGFMQPIKVTRQPASIEGGVGRGHVELPCTRSGVERSRRSPGLRLTHQQQIDEYPSDLGCSFIQTLTEKPQPWLSVAFQKA